MKKINDNEKEKRSKGGNDRVRQSEKGWKRTFLARTGQEIGASLIVGIMNKVPTAPLLFAVIPVAYTRAPVVASLYQAVSSSLSLPSSLSPVILRRCLS